MSSFCSSCRENVQFYERDGLFYCSMCDVQSETMQVMECLLMDSQPSQSMGTPYSKSKAIKVSSSSKRSVDALSETDGETSSIEMSKSWWMAEVFQEILRAQVSALIDMGVTPKLEMVVKNIWFKYLKNADWAFISKDREKALAKKEKGRSKRRKKKSETSTGWNTEDSMSTLLTSRLRPGDASLFNGERRGEVFRLPHLLCILYLALRWLRLPILLTDLLRWVCEGHLPYCANSDLIPGYMEENFSNREKNIFSVAKPNLLRFSQLLAPMSQVYRVSRLPPIPSQPLIHVVQRYVVSLNLPASFHKFVFRLFRLHPTKMADTACKPKRTPATRRRQSPFLEEGPALAYVVVAIKLTFGLDDRTEFELSELGRRVASRLPADSGIVPFIWEDWVAAQQLRMGHHQKDIDHFNPAHARRVRDTSKFIRHHSRMLQLKAKRDHDYSYRRYQAKSLNEVLQRPFNNLRNAEDGTNTDIDEEGPQPTCFPYSPLYLTALQGDHSQQTQQDRGLGRARESRFQTQEGRSQEWEGQSQGEQDGVEGLGWVWEGPSQGESEGVDNSDHHQHVGMPRVHWLSKRELRSTDFSQHSTDYLTNLRRFCKKHGLAEGEVAAVAESATEGRSPRAHTSEEDAGPTSDGGGANSGEVEEELTEEERAALSYEEWRARILAGAGGSKGGTRHRGSEGETEQGRGERETGCGHGDGSTRYRRTRGFPKSYVRYGERGFDLALSDFERDGSAPKGALRPFHSSYQWLLEHCAALSGLEWTDIHQAVLNLERGIFALDSSEILVKFKPGQKKKKGEKLRKKKTKEKFKKKKAKTVG